MLLPQVPEMDVWDVNGDQVDDINSVFEYIMVQLGFDHHPDDEDNDAGQNFRVPTFQQYTFNQDLLSQPTTNDFVIKPSFFNKDDYKISNLAYDILIPPPKV